MRNSLLFRIAGPYIFLSVFLISAIGIYLNNFIKTTLLTSLEQQLMIEATMLSDQVESLITNNSFADDLETIVSRNAALIDARISIIEKSGRVVIDSEIDSDLLENHSTRPEVIEAINTGFGNDIRMSGSLNEELIYVAVPIFNNQQETIAITRLAVPITDFSRQLMSFQIILLIILIILILVTFFISFLITKKTLKPLKRLLGAIEDIETHPQIFDSTNQKDEIEKLSEYIWKLTEKLKRQNEEIKQEQKTLSTVLNQMTDAVVIIDENGLIKLANPSAARMFDLDDEPGSERTIVEYFRNYQIVDLIKKCQKQLVQNEISVEINQNKLFVHIIAKPVQEIYKNGVLLIIQDYTRVHRLEKVRSDFVSNVSHELRTPIASIKALSDTLQEGALDDPPAAKRFLQRLNVEIDNLTQLVQELLELSKIESGRVSLKKISINPFDLGKNAVERMAVQAERSGLELIFKFPENISTIDADPDRIGQVFVNLIHNAIKFTEPGGSILIEVNEDETDIVFCIRDTGIGIEKELQTRIFERFYKTDRARTSGGTGLGLSIVKHIIEAHNGRVWLNSNPGEGSSFFFSLPKKPQN
jgi:two-component system phosphate regulon sensor histidine kinase PhoR